MSRLARPDVLTNPQAERAIRRLVDFHEARGDAMKAESYRRLLPGRKGT
jgi:hypothetical protein